MIITISIFVGIVLFYFYNITVIHKPRVTDSLIGYVIYYGSSVYVPITEKNVSILRKLLQSMGEKSGSMERFLDETKVVDNVIYVNDIYVESTITLRSIW